MSALDALLPRDRRRAQDFIARLGTICDGEPPSLQTLPDALRELLCAELGVTYAIERRDSEVALQEFHASGRDMLGYARDFDAALRASKGVPYIHFNALHPELRQRNRVVAFRVARFAERDKTLLRRHGCDRMDQLRVLLCEGTTLLAWVGVLSSDGIRAMDRALLAAVAPTIQRRLLLDRHLQLAPVALQLLGGALDALGVPAFLLRGEAVEHCNAPGRAALESDRRGVLDSLQAAMRGQGDGSYALTRTSSAGAPGYTLAVGRATAEDGRARAAVLAARWLLSPRQAEVLARLARGRSNKAIAVELGCGEGTVEFHVTALLAKAECQSRAELVARFWSAS